jgi:hypothetical protein
MFKLIKVLFFLFGLFFAYHSTVCLIDIDRASEHTAALYGLAFSFLIVIFALFAPSTIE